MSDSLSKFVPRNRYAFLFSITILTMVHPTTLGYDSMMTGGILNLDSYLSYFDLTTATIGLNSASSWMGKIIACFYVSQVLNDNSGRKNAIIAGVAILFAGIVLQSAAVHIAMFIVGRILIGYGGVITNIAAINLVAELCPIHLRGFLLGLAFSCFLVGSLISSGITFGVRNAPGNWNWRIPSIIQGAPNIVALINLTFLPESPKYLLFHGQEKKAFETLMIINNNDEVLCAQKIEDYKIEDLRISSRTFRPWTQLYKSRINLHRVFINLTQAVCVEMGGSSVGSHYLTLLLIQAGITDSTERLQVNIVMSAWQLVCAVSGSLCFDTLGRKRQCLIGLSGMVVMFYILGGLIKEYGDGHSRSGSFGSIAAMFLFSGFYSFSFTPLTTGYPAELYPFLMRGAGVSIYEIFDGCFGLIASFALPFAMENLGWKFYIINASYDILFLPIIYYVWIETKGVDIEKIDEIFWNHPLHKDKIPHQSESESDLERQTIEITQKI